MPFAKRKAFSLVELVIVIVILGVIAAVAIPRISSARRNSGESALRGNLATIRSAIDRYYLEHNNTYPAAKGDGVNDAGSSDAFLSQLQNYTDIDGIASADRDSAFPFGPYIRGKFPALPVGVNAGEDKIKLFNDAAPLTVDPSKERGWFFNRQTGQFIANADEAGSDGQPYSAW